jgi:dsRNA-specific ribonuclease
MAPETNSQTPIPNNSLPNLPLIPVPTLLKRVFRHKSDLEGLHSVNAGFGLLEPDNNERLAFIGSHTLRSIVANELYGILAHSTKGDLSVSYLLCLQSTFLFLLLFQKILDKFVKVENVSIWSEWYSFPTRMTCLSANRMTLVSNMNTKAQLFHAYLGALCKSKRMHQAEQWIQSLINYQTEQEDAVTLHGSPSQPNVDLPAVNSNNESIESGSSFTEMAESVTDDAETLVNETGAFKHIILEFVADKQVTGQDRNANRSGLPTSGVALRTSSTILPVVNRTPIRANGVNAVSLLNELVQKGILRRLEWVPERNGAEHNLMWRVILVGRCI